MAGTQESLNLLTTEEGKQMLADRYAGVIENLFKALISMRCKNNDLSGTPDSGSVTAKRIANATSKAYGTARAAGKGDAVKDKDVVINIDTDREIVEELEAKDIGLGTVKDLVNRRTANHPLVMLAELDKAFFRVAAAAGIEVDVTGESTIAGKLEALIQECENTKNQFVEGVDRAQMFLALNTKMYGKVRNDLDKTTRANVDTAAEEFYAWHGVETVSCVNLPSDVEAILMVRGSVAQPVLANTYDLEKIGLSEAYAIELFYHYGTKAVSPDLIFVVRKTSIALDKSTATVAANATVALEATTVPAGATVTWASSDSTKATVSDGTVTGVAAGTADITASITVEGATYTATCAVTVTE